MPTTEQQLAQLDYLNPQKLLEDAKKSAGLTDYGDMRFTKNLSTLLERAANEVNFTPEGIKSYRENIIIRCLVNRLRIEHDFKKHPEICEENISNPIIIIGLPRSGTTKTQRILGTGPGVQKPTLSKLMNPVPFPDAVAGEPDPRIAAIGKVFGTWSDDAAAGHPIVVEDAEEDMLLFDFAFDDLATGYNNYLPLFSPQGHLDDYSADAAYGYVYKLMQHLQWQDGGKQDRPWILKAINHIGHMDSLLKYYPNATLLHCHRSPLSTVPSMAKFMKSVWEMKTHPIDKKFIGQGMLQLWSTAMNRYLEARTRLNLDERIYDINYSDMRDNPLPVLKKVYQRANIAWTKDAETCAQQWNENNEQGKHGRHAYSLEEFGLSEAMVNDAFAQYIERFIN